MSSDPLVSIIIPVYNGANYVGEAIRSALAQTYPHIEIIVVNDGSNDNGATRRVAESFGDRIRLITKPNGGVATALNAGIAGMRGQLFSWLSHDDLYKPDKVARQVETLRRFGQQCVVIGDFELMNEDGKFAQRVSLKGHNLIARPLDAVFLGLINGCALLVPRELFDRAGVFEPGLPTTQDYHLWYRVARLAPFVHCAYADVRQRVHALQGSRHSSHIEEASRMFAHLIDATPVRLMRAYDGSELRFLLKVRQALSTYPGLHSYLSYRIGSMMRHLSYSVVLCNDSRAIPANEIATLKEEGVSPENILVVTYPESGRRPAAVQPDEQIEVKEIVATGTHPADIVEAAAKKLRSGIAVFFRVSRMPLRGQLPAALESLIAADADLARPRSSGMASEIDGLVARHDALRTFTEILRQPALDLEDHGTRLQTIFYEPAESLDSDTAEAIDRALQGKERVDYHRGISENAVARLLASKLNPGRPGLLFLMHSSGGGAHTHLNSLIRALTGKANCLVGFGMPTGQLHITFLSENAATGLVFELPDHAPDLARILRQAGISRIDVHHTLGFEEEAELLLDALNLPFDLTLVDYHVVANSPSLCLPNGRFVGDHRLRNLEYKLLRRAPLPFVWKASRVIAISRDLAARMTRLVPGLPVIPVRLWHDKPVGVRHVFVPRIWDHEPLRVMVTGVIAPHKGQEVVLEVARIAALRELPIRVHVLGQMDIAPELRQAPGEVLTIHGPYQSGRFSESLGGIAPHVAWLPSQAPETWSYVLTDLMEACLPIAATAVGAIPERCQGRAHTWLLPVEATAEEWIDLFLQLHASGLQEPPRWTNIDHLPQTKAMYFDEYLYPESPISDR